MSVGRKTGSKPVAFITSLMVLFALVVPFVGTALAGHGATNDTTALTITPTSDSAPAGTCNAFTVTATGANGAAAEGETIDVTATQSDEDLVNDIEVRFCDPDDEGPGTALAGPSGGPGNEGDAAADCDDYHGNRNDGTLNNCHSDGTEDSAEIHDEGFTNASGQFTFGVVSNEPGTMNILVFAESDATTTPESYNGQTTNTTGDGIFNNNEPFARATKTWTEGGGNAARSISCTPATDSNPEGSRHEFQCTVLDANGAVVQGVNVFFDVTAGPNADEIGPTQCPGTTNAQGQTQPANTTGDADNTDECGYTDLTTTGTTPATASPPGTDTITAYVNQTSGTTGTTGPDAGEPQTTITKTFVGPARSIDCEPEEQTVAPGASAGVVCTVTDAAGNPVSGESVTFTETGPGRIVEIQPDNTTATPNEGQTDASGQVTVRVQSFANESGTQTVTGTLTSDVGDATTGDTDDECDRAAGTPTGAPAGQCADSVTVTYAEAPPPPPAEPQCSDGVDNDGDGAIDFPDDNDCDNIEDNNEADVGGRFPTAITIRYNRKATPPAFKGALASPRRECVVGRTIILKKKRPGKDRIVGRDTSNRRGNWEIVKRRARGRYYAVVRGSSQTTAGGATVICGRDRSVTIAVTRRG